MNSNDKKNIEYLNERIEKLEDLMNTTFEVKKEKKVNNKYKTIVALVIRSLILGLVLFSITILIREFIDKKNTEQPVNKQFIRIEPTKNEIKNVDSVKIFLKKEIDLLEVKLIDEVSGKGSSQSVGYGQRAMKIKKELDSLKNELKTK